MYGAHSTQGTMIRCFVNLFPADISLRGLLCHVVSKYQARERIAGNWDCRCELCSPRYVPT